MGVLPVHAWPPLRLHRASVYLLCSTRAIYPAIICQEPAGGATMLSPSDLLGSSSNLPRHLLISALPILLVCLCVYVYARVCECVHVCVCVCTCLYGAWACIACGDQRMTSCVFLNCSLPTYIFKNIFPFIIFHYVYACGYVHISAAAMEARRDCQIP